MQRIYKIVIISLVLASCAIVSLCQEVKKYSKDGVAFDYLPGWKVTDQTEPDLQQISISNTQTDSQILITVLRKRAESKDPMPELKKQVIDPWLTKLLGQYTQAGIKVEQSPASTEIAGQLATGSKLNFMLDGQAGTGETYWLLLEKRLFLLYIIRPEKMAEKATPGWDSIRNSLRVESAKEK